MVLIHQSYRQTDGRHAIANTALCTIVHRAVKTSADWASNASRIVRQKPITYITVTSYPSVIAADRYIASCRERHTAAAAVAAAVVVVDRGLVD